VHGREVISIRLLAPLVTYSINRKTRLLAALVTYSNQPPVE
jgi:hypothetical protein